MSAEFHHICLLISHSVQEVQADMMNQPDLEENENKYKHAINTGLSVYVYVYMHTHRVVQGVLRYVLGESLHWEAAPTKK